MLLATLLLLRRVKCFARGFFSAARIALLLVDRTLAVTIEMINFGKSRLASEAILMLRKSRSPTPRVAPFAICRNRLAASRALTMRMTSSVKRIVRSIAFGSLSNLAKRRRWVRSARALLLLAMSRSSETSLTVTSMSGSVNAKFTPPR